MMTDSWHPLTDDCKLALTIIGRALIDHGLLNTQEPRDAFKKTGRIWELVPT